MVAGRTVHSFFLETVEAVVIDEGHYLQDKPLVIESYAEEEAIHDPVRLNLLVDFCKRMGKTLDQQSIMIAFGNVRYYIEEYGNV